MMMHAYDKIFLDDAMENLGNAMEYAVYGLGMSAQEFWDCFAVSRVAERFACGDVRYVSGMSGLELAECVSIQQGFTIETERYELHIDYTPEYWGGWALAYYQWHTAKSFEMLARKISFDAVLNLYGVLHEADLSKVVEVFDCFFEEQSMANLAQIRLAINLSQSELAHISGISLRSIQMYEQRNNDINKAQLNRLLALARALGCRVEELLE